MNPMMMVATATSAAAVLLAARLLFVGSRLKTLSECVRRRETRLIERRATFGISRSIDAIHEELNSMIGEARGTLDRDLEYLGQIETTLGSIREAVLIIDDDSVVSMANEAARSLIDPLKPLTGRRVEGLVPSVAFLDYMKSVRAGSKAGNALVEIVRGSETLWFEVMGSPIPGGRDGSNLYLFVLHDITKLKALENMRTEFVANVSHELRTPVTVIRGFTDMLLEEDAKLSDAERVRFLAKIQRNVTRLNNLLDDLLLLSRLEGRAPMLKLETLSLNDLVHEVCENFKDRINAGCTLDVIPDPTVPLLPLDHLRISQVLDNLLDNANRHARGMTRLTVRTELRGANVVATVEDNGCGIPAGDVPHIFERFYRVDKGRSRESGGTGLGLSIVKHIVMQHGGKVFIESGVGEGTTFGFEIPVSAKKS